MIQLLLLNLDLWRYVLLMPCMRRWRGTHRTFLHGKCVWLGSLLSPLFTEHHFYSEDDLRSKLLLLTWTVWQTFSCKWMKAAIILRKISYWYNGQMEWALLNETEAMLTLLKLPYALRCHLLLKENVLAMLMNPQIPELRLFPKVYVVWNHLLSRLENSSPCIKIFTPDDIPQMCGLWSHTVWCFTFPHTFIHSFSSHPHTGLWVPKTVWRWESGDSKRLS